MKSTANSSEHNPKASNLCSYDILLKPWTEVCFSVHMIIMRYDAGSTLYKQITGCFYL